MGLQSDMNLNHKSTPKKKYVEEFKVTLDAPAKDRDRDRWDTSPVGVYG